MRFVQQVMGVVDVKHVEDHEVVLEWTSGASNDMIADTALTLLTSADSSPASVKSVLIYIFSHGTHTISHCRLPSDFALSFS
jgi:cleavage and polyadenylation specificity factor subunit 3